MVNWLAHPLAFTLKTIRLYGSMLVMVALFFLLALLAPVLSAPLAAEECSSNVVLEGKTVKLTTLLRNHRCSPPDLFDSFFENDDVLSSTVGYGEAQKVCFGLLELVKAGETRNFLDDICLQATLTNPEEDYCQHSKDRFAPDIQKLIDLSSSLMLPGGYRSALEILSTLDRANCNEICGGKKTVMCDTVVKLGKAFSMAKSPIKEESGVNASHSVNAAAVNETRSPHTDVPVNSEDLPKTENSTGSLKTHFNSTKETTSKQLPLITGDHNPDRQVSSQDKNFLSQNFPGGQRSSGSQLGTGQTTSYQQDSAGRNQNFPGQSARNAAGRNQNIPGQTNWYPTGRNPNVPGQPNWYPTGRNPNIPGQPNSYSTGRNNPVQPVQYPTGRKQNISGQPARYPSEPTQNQRTPGGHALYPGESGSNRNTPVGSSPDPTANFLNPKTPEGSVPNQNIPFEPSGPQNQEESDKDVVRNRFNKTKLNFHLDPKNKGPMTSDLGEEKSGTQKGEELDETGKNFIGKAESRTKPSGTEENDLQENNDLVSETNSDSVTDEEKQSTNTIVKQTNKSKDGRKKNDDDNVEDIKKEHTDETLASFSEGAEANPMNTAPEDKNNVEFSPHFDPFSNDESEKMDKESQQPLPNESEKMKFHMGSDTPSTQPTSQKSTSTTTEEMSIDDEYHGYGTWHFVSIFLIISVIAIVGYFFVHNRKKLRESLSGQMAGKGRRKNNYRPLSQQ